MKQDRNRVLKSGGAPARARASRQLPTTAFTLMEVMIACSLFFLATFAILGLVTQCLRNARSLQRIEVNAGMVAAQLYKTNQLTEGRDSGDFGKLYRDYSWETETEQIGTNGLWQVDIIVMRRGLKVPADAMSVWVFSPNSKSSAFGGRGR
jgi:Tfp pilus assembly protein PilV